MQEELEKYLFAPVAQIVVDYTLLALPTPDEVDEFHASLGVQQDDNSLRARLIDILLAQCRRLEPSWFEVDTTGISERAKAKAQKELEAKGWLIATDFTTEGTWVIVDRKHADRAILAALEDIENRDRETAYWRL